MHRWLIYVSLRVRLEAFLRDVASLSAALGKMCGLKTEKGKDDESDCCGEPERWGR